MSGQDARDDAGSLRIEIADEISGVQVGDGYYATTIGINAALEAADLLIAAGYRKHQEPAMAELTDAEWREFQAIPEQGYSHRHWVNNKIQQRIAGNPVT